MGYKINIRNALDSGWNNILKDENIEHDYTTTGVGTSATDSVELALKYIKDNYVNVNQSLSYRQTISPASSAWIIRHGLGTKLVDVSVMDYTTGEKVTPASITYNNTMTLTVLFSENVTGEILIIKDYYTEGSVSHRYKETVTTASTAWTINHNLSASFVDVSVMDYDNDVLIAPKTVSYPSSAQVYITFTEPVSGEVLLLG
jgi:hypothetical protein